MAGEVSAAAVERQYFKDGISLEDRMYLSTCCQTVTFEMWPFHLESTNELNQHIVLLLHSCIPGEGNEKAQGESEKVAGIFQGGWSELI